MKLSTIFAGALVVVAAGFAVGLMAMPSPAQKMDSESSRVFTDKKHNCRYLVGGTEEGLHIVITGAEHCRTRILIDGVRINVGQRARL